MRQKEMKCYFFNRGRARTGWRPAAGSVVNESAVPVWLKSINRASRSRQVVADVEEVKGTGGVVNIALRGAEPGLPQVSP